MYPELNLPKADLRITHDTDGIHVFDVFRKLNVELTPEEWVRQHVLHFLTVEKGYPKGLIEVEKSIRLFNTDKRVDILVRSAELKPLLLVECKAPEVKLTQEELNQLGRYQITLNAPLCMLTNGLQHFVMLNKEGKLGFSDNLPSYSEI